LYELVRKTEYKEEYNSINNIVVSKYPGRGAQIVIWCYQNPKNRSDNTMADKKAQEIMDEYDKELKKFFAGNSEKTFDEITNNMLDKMKEVGKDTAEKAQKEVENNSKKKIISCPVCGKEIKPNRYNAPITITTYNFPLDITRNVYYCRDCQIGIDPLFDVFNIYQGHKITIDLALELARCSQKNSAFGEAKEDIKHYLDLDISESVITQVAEDIGNEVHKNDIEKADAIDEHYEEYIPDVRENDKKDCTLYIMADGSMLSIKTEENGVCWKENKLGMVYTDNNQLKRTDGKHIITEKEYVSYLGSPDNFKKMLMKAAINVGYGTIENVVFIGDGAQWLWNMCDELFPEAVQILDFYHLSENIHNYAEYLYPDDEIQRKQWAKNALEEIKAGNIDTIINQLPDEVPDCNNGQQVPNLKTYLTNNKNRVNYNEYKKQGYIIGSGSVESAHGKVIQQRLKQPGMHWSPKGCQSIASLRTKYCSNQWDEVEEIIYKNAS
jgi:hypothetical protein